VASPNCDARPVRTNSDLLVIHGISLPPNEYGGGAIEQFFTNSLDHSEHPYFEKLKGVRVSSHFLVRRSGQIVQLFPAAAGMARRLSGVAHGADFSIGIGGRDFRLTRKQLLVHGSISERTYPIRDIVGIRLHPNARPIPVRFSTGKNSINSSPERRHPSAFSITQHCCRI
jgi:AmpD protein